MNWNLATLGSHTAPKRRPPGNLGWHTEICEERILLSATALGAARSTSGTSASTTVAAKVAAPSPTPKIVRDPSSGGPNGTTFLANDASTPPNWAQQQNAIVTPPLDAEVNSTTPALNEANLPVSGAFNVGVGTSLNGTPLGGNVFGGPTLGNFAFNDQSLAQSQANYSTSTFAFQSRTGGTADGQSGSPGENGLNGLSGSNSLNGLGATLPLPDFGVAPEHDLAVAPLPSLDLAFLQTVDTTTPALEW